MHCRLILVISSLLDGCRSVKWPTGMFPCSDFSLLTLQSSIPSALDIYGLDGMNVFFGGADAGCLWN